MLPARQFDKRKAQDIRVHWTSNVSRGVEAIVIGGSVDLMTFAMVTALLDAQGLVNDVCVPLKSVKKDEIAEDGIYTKSRGGPWPLPRSASLN
jgi:hypothetical protein